MKKKELIIIGGNSILISKFLELNLNKFYRKITIISHRKYQGEIKRYNIVDCLEPQLLEKTLKAICSNNLFNYDLIVSNTPSIKSNFTKEKTREWSMTTLKVINMLSFNINIKKVIYTGSCLPLLPTYHESIYKRLKDLEMRCYINLKYHEFKKNSYIILPPLKLKKNNHINVFFETYEKWSLIIFKELNLNNSILYPSGFIGFITKILFYLRFKIL